MKRVIFLILFILQIACSSFATDYEGYTDGNGVFHGAGYIGKEITTPSVPLTGHDFLYPKSDGLWYSLTHAGVETAIGSGGVTGITSLNGLTGGTQTFVNDTNLKITSTGTTHTLGWIGTLGASRLNSNVVQSIVNDTNIVGVITDQVLTLGWTGVLDPSRGGTSLTSPPYIDVRLYDSLNACVASSDSLNKTILVPDAQTLTASLTIPSTRSILILKGGSITKASNYTLTINGPFEAGLYQVFIGFGVGASPTYIGDVTFALGTVKEVYPQWWGALGTATTNAAIASIRATGGKIIFTNSADFTSSINATGIAHGMIFEGISSTTNITGPPILNAKNTEGLFDCTSSNDLIFRNLIFSGDTVTVPKYGFLLARDSTAASSQNHRFENVTTTAYSQFSIATLYSYGSEVLELRGCNFQNSYPTGKVFVSTSYNIFSLTSTYQTILTGVASNAVTNIYGGSMQNGGGGATADTLYLEGAVDFHVYGQVWINSAGRSHVYTDTTNIVSSNCSFDGIRGEVGAGSRPDYGFYFGDTARTINNFSLTNSHIDASIYLIESNVNVTLSGLFCKNNMAGTINVNYLLLASDIWGSPLTATYVQNSSITGASASISIGSGTNNAITYLDTGNVTMDHLELIDLAAITTAAESWIGPSLTTGIYFKSGFIGIGGVPTDLLHIQRPNITNSTGGLTIENLSTIGWGEAINFIINSSGASPTRYTGGRINVEGTVAGGGGVMTFFTPTVAAPTTLASAMTIKDGLIGFNESTPSEIATVKGRLALGETTGPSPTASYGKVYVKSYDHKLYFMDSSGAEIPLAGGTTTGTYSERVAASGDDTYIITPSTFDATVSIVAAGNWGGSSIGDSSLLFQSVTIPQGANITSAFLTFTAVQILGSPITNFYGDADASGNATAPTDYATFTGKTLTTAHSADWSPSTWTLNATYTSPTLVSIVQEIVNMAVWVSGNNMQFFWKDHSSSLGDILTAWSYDGDTGKAALLTITYIPSGGSSGGNVVAGSAIPGQIARYVTDQYHIEGVTGGVVPQGGNPGQILSKNSSTDYDSHWIFSSTMGSSCVDIRTYGAVGNGSTDDSTAIQAAMTVATGGCLYIPKGVFIVDNATLQQAAGTLDIKGDGWGSVLKGSANPIIARDTTITSTLRISNLTIWGTSNNTLLYLQGYAIASTPINASFGLYNINFYSSYATPSDSPIMVDIMNCVDGDIQNCFFRMAAGYYTAGTGVRIKSSAGYQSTNNNISDSTFKYIKNGILVDHADNLGSNEGTRVTNCNIVGVWYGVQFIRSLGCSIVGGMIDNVVRPVTIDSCPRLSIGELWIAARGQSAIDIKATYADAYEIYLNNLMNVGAGSIEETSLYGINLNVSASYTIHDVYISNCNINPANLIGINLNGSAGKLIDTIYISNSAINTGTGVGIRMNYVNKMSLNNIAFSGSNYAVQEINPIDTAVRNYIGFVDLGPTLGISATTVGSKLGTGLATGKMYINIDGTSRLLSVGSASSCGSARCVTVPN